jgi:DNA-binding NarL/FixJ family response regulator
MNILLIDDHPLFGIGLAHALSAQPGTDVRTVNTLAEGLAMAAHWPALELVLIDYRLGDEDGLEGLRRFGQQHPLVARVLISGDDDPQLALRARAAGASGFLPKSLSLQGLTTALRAVADGGLVFDTSGVKLAAATASSAPTHRQQEVLSLVAQGMPNKHIARELGIAERTVKLHITALFHLVGARNRTHLLVRAGECGWL